MPFSAITQTISKYNPRRVEDYTLTDFYLRIALSQLIFYIVKDDKYIVLFFMSVFIYFFNNIFLIILDNYLYHINELIG